MKHFDNTFDRMMSLGVGFNLPSAQPSFPPHNVIKYNDNQYTLEIALAGYSKSDVTISVKDNILTVSSKKVEDSASKEYIHRGIALRQFKKEFILGEFMEISKATFVDGLLIIDLDRVVPDNRKERFIDIN